ncbi:transposase [Actinosynnema sp. NPDC059797]
MPRRSRNPGRKWVPDRQVWCGTLFVPHTGIQREFLPRELGFGSGMTCRRRLRPRQVPPMPARQENRARIARVPVGRHQVQELRDRSLTPPTATGDVRPSHAEVPRSWGAGRQCGAAVRVGGLAAVAGTSGGGPIE